MEKMDEASFDKDRIDFVKEKIMVVWVSVTYIASINMALIGKQARMEINSRITLFSE